MRPTLIPTLIALTVLAGSVRAEDLVGVPAPAPGGKAAAECPKGGDHRPEKLMEETIKRFDKDGDGKLNEEERTAAKAATKAAHEKRMAEMKEKNPELFKKLDLDGDGTLSPEEMRRAHEMRKNGPGGGEGGKDGKPTEEQKAAMKERLEKMKEKNPELFKRIDKDGDGRISPEELRSAHEFMQQHRKGGEGEGHRPGGDGKPAGPGAGPGTGPNVEKQGLNL